MSPILKLKIIVNIYDAKMNFFCHKTCILRDMRQKQQKIQKELHLTILNHICRIKLRPRLIVKHGI